MSHCWTERGEWIEETYGYLSDEYLDYAADQYNEDACSEICLLSAGHVGPHKWTRTDEATLSFADKMPEVALPPCPEK